MSVHNSRLSALSKMPKFNLTRDWLVDNLDSIFEYIDEKYSTPKSRSCYLQSIAWWLGELEVDPEVIDKVKSRYRGLSQEHENKKAENGLSQAECDNLVDFFTYSCLRERLVESWETSNNDMYKALYLVMTTKMPPLRRNDYLSLEFDEESENRYDLKGGKMIFGKTSKQQQTAEMEVPRDVHRFIVKTTKKFPRKKLFDIDSNQLFRLLGTVCNGKRVGTNLIRASYETFLSGLKISFARHNAISKQSFHSAVTGLIHYRKLNIPRDKTVCDGFKGRTTWSKNGFPWISVKLK